MSALAGNGAPGASSIGPTSGYSLILLYLIKFMLNLNKCTCLVSLIIVMKLLINYMCNFGIKMYPKIPIYLTHVLLNCSYSR
jgi:hypothetical protein